MLFTTASAQGGAFQNDVVNLDRPALCRDMARARLRWLEARKNDPVVRCNLDRALAHRLAGFDPLMVGAPRLV